MWSTDPAGMTSMSRMLRMRLSGKALRAHCAVSIETFPWQGLHNQAFASTYIGLTLMSPASLQESRKMHMSFGYPSAIASTSCSRNLPRASGLVLKQHYYVATVGDILTRQGKARGIPSLSYRSGTLARICGRSSKPISEMRSPVRLSAKIVARELYLGRSVGSVAWAIWYSSIPRELEGTVLVVVMQSDFPSNYA